MIELVPLCSELQLCKPNEALSRALHVWSLVTVEGIVGTVDVDAVVGTTMLVGQLYI